MLRVLGTEGVWFQGGQEIREAVPPTNVQSSYLSRMHREHSYYFECHNDTQLPTLPRAMETYDSQSAQVGYDTLHPHAPHSG